MTEDFQGFGLPAKLLQALERMQFKAPTPVQKEAIPLALAGNDILGSAQTGTGKTGAFGIPLIAKLMENPTAQALVMTPTRELASQVMAALQQMIPVPTIKTALLIGGEAMPRQFRQLDHNPRLIVGTPGRITDHLMRGKLKLTEARFLVLDETDRMLDMGFGPQIDKIMEYMPGERQTMMFSATLPENIIRMSRKYMKEPKRIAVGSTNTAHIKIKQEVIKMGEGEKYQHLLAQLGERSGSIIIFVKTKYGTEKLADRLNKDQHKADAIHGDLQQRRRERVIQGFRDKRYRILVATDVAARGLDIPHIEHVVNYDLPQCPEDYIHRIGRTARAGAEGAAVNFLTPSDNGKWNAIYRLMNPGAPANNDRREGGRSNGAPGGNRRGPPNRNKRWGAPGGQRRDRDGAGNGGNDRRSHQGSGDRYAPAGNAERPAGNFEHRNSGERRPFKDGDRPAGNGERRSFNRDERRPRNGDDRPAGNGERRNDGERRSFNGGDRRPQNGGERRANNGNERRGNQDGGYKGNKTAASQ
jgi:superfamily II DNA/RNA helicase